MTIRRFLMFAVVAGLSLVPQTAAAATDCIGPDAPGHAAPSQNARQGSEQTERFSSAYVVDGEPALDVSQLAGRVRVTPGRGKEIRIEAVKRVQHRDPEEARRLLDAIRIDVTQAGGRVQVRTVYPRTARRGWNGGVDYTITVPAATAVSIKTVSGDISVSNVRGEVRVETISGDIEVASTPNLAVARAVSGDVRARDIAAATLTLGTVSGTVTATALKVRTLDANSVSGDLRLSDLQVERLSAKTLSGDIVFDGDLARGGRYEFHAHSGDVQLMLDSGTPGFELDASTFSGSVRSDFPVTLRVSPENASSRRGATRAIRGTYGKTGAILSLRSFSGSVTISRK